MSSARLEPRSVVCARTGQLCRIDRLQHLYPRRQVLVGHETEEDTYFKFFCEYLRSHECALSGTMLEDKQDARCPGSDYNLACMIHVPRFVPRRGKFELALSTTSTRLSALRTARRIC